MHKKTVVAASVLVASLGLGSDAIAQKYTYPDCKNFVAYRDKVLTPGLAAAESRIRDLETRLAKAQSLRAQAASAKESAQFGGKCDSIVTPLAASAKLLDDIGSALSSIIPGPSKSKLVLEVVQTAKKVVDFATESNKYKMALEEGALEAVKKKGTELQKASGVAYQLIKAIKDFEESKKSYAERKKAWASLTVQMDSVFKDMNTRIGTVQAELTRAKKDQSLVVEARSRLDSEIATGCGLYKGMAGIP